MRDIKKDRTPAKGNGLVIGNRRTGNTNLAKRAYQYNRQRRVLVELEQTLISGYSTYQRVFRALESRFEGGQNG